jgi:hypothetical protein
MKRIPARRPFHFGEDAQVVDQEELYADETLDSRGVTGFLKAS